MDYVASNGEEIVVAYGQSFGSELRYFGQRLDSSLDAKGDPVIFPPVRYFEAFEFRNGRFNWYGFDQNGKPYNLSFTAETMAAPDVTSESALLCGGQLPERVSGTAACVEVAAVLAACDRWVCWRDETRISFTHDDGFVEKYSYPYLVNLAPAFAAGDMAFLFVWRDREQGDPGHLFALLTLPSSHFDDPMERQDKIVIDEIPSTGPLDGAYAAFDGERFAIVWSVRMELHFAILDPKTRAVSNVTTLGSEPPRPWFYWTRRNTKLTAIGRGRFLVSYELGLDPTPFEAASTLEGALQSQRVADNEYIVDTWFWIARSHLKREDTAAAKEYLEKIASTEVSYERKPQAMELLQRIA